MLDSSKMSRILIWVVLVSLFVLINSTNSVEHDAKSALINFISKLSAKNGLLDPTLGWNLTSDPCNDWWKGVYCDDRSSVKKISLDGFNLSGVFDAGALCSVESLSSSLSLISLNDNNVRGENLDRISNCRHLTHLYISGNRFTGSLPNSFTGLHNLKRLDISRNDFSGSLPDLSKISGLMEFQAQKNRFSGPIPSFDFSNFVAFNLSFNNFSGRIPDGGARFPSSSFLNNPELCGDPLPNKCLGARFPPSRFLNDPELCGDPLPNKCLSLADTVSGSGSDSEPAAENPPEKKKGGFSRDQILMFSGYFLIGFALFIIIILKVCKKKKKTNGGEVDKVDLAKKKVAAVDEYDDDDYSTNDPSFVSKEYKSGLSKSEISETPLVSSSLVVLTSPEVNGLKFEDLLKAPAELIGRGRHGSSYKVACEDQRMTVVAKRIKDWPISTVDFTQRMRRLDQVKHRNVLPAVAFYCSRQEKLLVYEYQINGSLFKLLHGNKMGQVFDWSSRLGIASTVAETLAFMHYELRQDGIPHGNLKSSNILLNKNMEPCISEYGLMTNQNQNQNQNQDQELFSLTSIDSNNPTEENESKNAFKEDTYGLGVILLELLTGKMVMENGMDLATWVVSVVKEEWTVEVFDRALVRECASEERMVNLLRIAVKCVNRSAEERPSVKQVALLLNTLKEEDERSMDVSDQP